MDGQQAPQVADIQPETPAVPPVAPVADQVLPPQTTPLTGQPSGIEAMIPYKNGKALAAYYLGVFGLIPILGIVLSILAIIFGILGLKQHKLHPENKGRTHALIGLWLGIFELIVFAGFVVFIVVINLMNPN